MDCKSILMRLQYVDTVCSNFFYLRKIYGLYQVIMTVLLNLSLLPNHFYVLWWTNMVFLENWNVCSLAPSPSTCSPVDGAIKMYFEQSRIKFDVEKAWFQQWSISEVIYSLVKCGMFRDLHSRFSSSRKKSYKHMILDDSIILLKTYSIRSQKKSQISLHDKKKFSKILKIWLLIRYNGDVATKYVTKDFVTRKWWQSTSCYRRVLSALGFAYSLSDKNF